MSIWRPIGCRSTEVRSNPVETRSTTPHSQMAVWHQNSEHRGRSTAESGFNEQRFGGVV